MDDGRAVAVQVNQAAQDLPRPALDHLLINVLVLLAVPGRISRQAGRQQGQPRRGLSDSADDRCVPHFAPPSVNPGQRSVATHCRRVPLVKSSVMKLTV